MTVFWIFIASGLGGICRYGVSIFTLSFYTHIFPLGTLIANLIGVFLIGMIFTKFEYSDMRNILMVGFCGGFTTFSTFSLETVTMFQSGRITDTVIYILSSLVGCALFCYLGIKLFS